MKTYIYTYRRGRQDANGNPSHWVRVFRVKRNVPTCLADDEPVHYLTPRMAVENVIAREEKWGSGRISLSTAAERVRRARMGGQIQLIQL